MLAEARLAADARLTDARLADARLLLLLLTDARERDSFGVGRRDMLARGRGDGLASFSDEAVESDVYCAVAASLEWPISCCVTRPDTMADILSVQRKPITLSRVSMYMIMGPDASRLAPPRFSRPKGVLWCC